MNRKLYSKLLTISELKHESIIQMFQLFQQYFDNCIYKFFLGDLKNKQYVIQLLDSNTDKIQGFTTLSLFSHTYLNRHISIVFSGDTIISKPFWWSNELFKRWIKTVLELTSNDEIPVYWVLISSGYRTYRLLPFFFKEFYPRYDIPTPRNKKYLLNDIAKKIFKDQFLREFGIVRFKQGVTYLKKELIDIDKNRPDNPHKNFFIKNNPGYIKGDELVCLTQISEDNFTLAGKRMLQ